MNMSDILHKPWVIPTAVGVVGIGAGFSAGFMIGKKAMLKEIQSDIRQVRDLEEYIDDALDEDIQEAMEELISDSDFVIVNEEIPDMDDVEELDEIRKKEEALAEEYDALPVTVTRNVFKDVENDQWVWEDELAHRAENAGEPYVIHHDEFMNNEKDFQQETLTYYKGDDIVADQEDKPIYNYAGLMGNLKFGHGSGDPNVVYIRNETIHMEWEVLLSDGSYEIEVMGLAVEQEYEEEDIKHDNNRRFRPD